MPKARTAKRPKTAAHRAGNTGTPKPSRPAARGRKGRGDPGTEEAAPPPERGGGARRGGPVGAWAPKRATYRRVHDIPIWKV